MPALFMPDKYFRSYARVTPEYLLSRGCRFLISDIDNTLAPYETAEPDAALLRWFGDMEKAGIKIALVSNNEQARVELFAKELRVKYFWDCKKPSRRFVRVALNALGAEAGETAYLGDQIFTDILAARLSHLRHAIILPPIRDKKTLLFKVKRAMEKPFMHLYFKKHPEDRPEIPVK